MSISITSVLTTLMVLVLALAAPSEARRSPRPILPTRTGGVDLSSYTVPLNNGKFQESFVPESLGPFHDRNRA